MAKASPSTNYLNNPTNKLVALGVILTISLIFVVLGVNHLNNSNIQSLVIYNSNAQTDKLVRTIIVRSSADGQTINTTIESEVGPSTAPSTLQSNDNTGQSNSLQPNSSSKVSGQVSTSPLQSNANINDPNIANSPLVQSVLSQ
ncbi:MAG TPA: hypothetical protein VIH90_03515 [Candidatus Saccharimonadales bacterium]